MKNINFLAISVLVIFSATAFAASEMDSEINDLQVRIVHVKPEAQQRAHKPKQNLSPKIYTYSARPSSRLAQRVAAPATSVTAPESAHFYRPVTVANSQPPATTETRHEVDSNGNTNGFQPTEQYQPYENTSQENTPQEEIRTIAPRSKVSSGQILRRIELIGSYTLSSFDGGDSASLQPGGVSNPYNSGPSTVSLLSDIDFGYSNFFAETGFLLTQIGAGTGIANGNGFNGGFTTISEKVSLTYIGIPLNLKYRLRDENTSSFYLKAGAIPVFMAGHSYAITGSGLSEELRFGAYNTFDLLFDGGVGYDLALSNSFHALAEISAFQGVFPVLANFSVLNYGVNLGLGIAYML